MTRAAASVAVIALLCLGALVLLYAGSSPPPLDPIRIGGPPLEQSALVYVALEQGFFEENGLSVTLRDDYPTGVGPVNDMAAGALDLAVAAEYPVLARILSDGDVSIIATIDKYENEELVCRGDLGVRNISDLKGRRIGLPRGTILEFFLGRLLDRNGVDYGEVTLVDVAPSHSADAIADGEVDAVMCFEPHTSRVLARLGENATVWPGQGDQQLYGVIAARDDWIDGHPDQLDRFLRSLEEARTHTLAHPDETEAIVKERLNLTDEYAAAVWPDHQFTLSLDHSLLAAMNDEAHWMIANNLTTATAAPDLREHIHAAALGRVRPEAVYSL